MNYIYPELHIPFKETHSSLHGLAVNLTIDSPFIPALSLLEKKGGAWGVLKSQQRYYHFWVCLHHISDTLVSLENSTKLKVMI